MPSRGNAAIDTSNPFLKVMPLVGYLGLYVFYSLGGINLAGERTLVLNLGQVVIPLAAIGFCRHGWRAAPSRQLKLSWVLLAASDVGWMAGSLIWTYLEVVSGVEAYVPSLADVMWMPCYPLIAVAVLLQIPARPIRLQTHAVALDALLLTLSICGLFWSLFLTRIADVIANPLASVLNVYYPTACMVIVFSVIALFVALPSRQWMSSHLWLAAGCIMLIVSDMFMAVASFHGGFHTGNPVEFGWQLSYLAMGIAPLVSCGRREEFDRAKEAPASPRPFGASRARQSARIWLPYGAVPAVALLFLSACTNGLSMNHPACVFAFALGGVMIVLVMLRQLLTVIENDRLSRSLAALSKGLEERVSMRTTELLARTEELTERTEELTKRTYELSVLNEVASRLSHCRTSSEVLTSGLELALEATRAKAGIVWLFDQSGNPEVASTVGVPEIGVSIASRTLEFLPGMLETVKSGQPVVYEREQLAAGLPKGFPHIFLPKGLMGVPLVSRGSVLGSMVLSVIDLELVAGAPQLGTAIGAQMGVALESARRFEDAKYLADRDPVTGLLNHRAVHRELDKELKRARRTGEGFTVVMMDVDGFKLFNDTYGHPTGDHVLKEVSALLLDEARTTDVIGRYGGDEFVAILPETDEEGAISFAQRVRTALGEKPYVSLDQQKVPIHLSFGVATYPTNGKAAHELVSFADSNLYESKEQGGDTITVGKSPLARDLHKAGSFGVLDGLVTAVDHKDKYTRKHSEDVTVYAVALARAMGLSSETERTLRIAGLLHDVGKIGVPDRILRKPSRLSEDESAVVKQHAMLGEMIIKDVPNITDVQAAVGTHHERIDGSGYPRGLSGERIPLLGRILAVADAYSAMTMDRPYRKAMSSEEARGELLKAAGTQLDAEIVKVFVRLLTEEAAEMTAYKPQPAGSGWG